jgi:hypothetical protein
MQITIAPPRSIEERLEAGAELLFRSEECGDTGPEYERWFERWLELLLQYEAEADYETYAA